MVVIRSQSRTILTECHKVHAFEEKDGDEHVWKIANGENILGCYKTKERALDVVSEIQEHIEFLADPYKTNSSICFDTYVFNMPKD